MKTRNYLLSFIIAGSICFVLQSCGPRYVTVVPARPVVVRSASPYLGAVWIDGNYHRGNYSPGYWGRPRHGRNYYPGQWNQGPHGYSWKGGRWR